MHCSKIRLRARRVFRCAPLEKHPDKTFIGRIERGFDFLGYPFRSGGIDRGQENDWQLHRESISALRAKAPRGFGRYCA
jgi:hypothetical protein